MDGFHRIHPYRYHWENIWAEFSCTRYYYVSWLVTEERKFTFFGERVHFYNELAPVFRHIALEMALNSTILSIKSDLWPIASETQHYTYWAFFFHLLSHTYISHNFYLSDEYWPRFEPFFWNLLLKLLLSILFLYFSLMTALFWCSLHYFCVHHGYSLIRSLDKDRIFVKILIGIIWY